MTGLARLTVGPRDDGPKKQADLHRRREFDASLPYSATELKGLGIDMAFDTLGRMGDDKSVDLPGAEWGWNLEMALNSAAEGSLTDKQLARRAKILRRLTE